MATKEIGCSKKGCVEILKVAPPDDTYMDIVLDQPEGRSIKREYKCQQKHTTKVYWIPHTRPGKSGAPRK